MSEEAAKIEGIDADNYADGYKKNAEALAQNKDMVEMDALCHKVFTTDEGKQLMNYIVNRFVVPQLANPNHPNFKETVIYFEGLKEGFRMLNNSVIAHKQRIQAAADKGE